MSRKNLPAVICLIIAAALILLAIFSPAKSGPTSPTATTTVSDASTTSPLAIDQTDLLAAVVPIRGTDHYRGVLTAPIKIIEYSDLECPFCKLFQTTLEQIVKDYPGRVVWIYRHFPLDSLHPKARHEAEAAECAAVVGGEEKFWAYIDRIFAITPSNNGLDPAELTNTAKVIGLDLTKFNLCLSTGQTKAKVDASVKEAIAAGANGTPFSIMVWPGGKQILNGAYPYSQMTKLIDNALNSIK